MCTASGQGNKPATIVDDDVLDSMATASRYGRLGLIRAKDAERKLRDRDFQLAAYTAENRQLKTANDNLQRTVDSLRGANTRLFQSAENYEQGVKRLYSVNAVLQKDAKKDFTLSFVVGGGLIGDKNRGGTGIFVGFALGYSFFKF